MTEFRFYFSYGGAEGYVSCHAATRQDAEFIFNIMGLHVGLGWIE